MTEKVNKYSGKIVVVGDGACGKTCLLEVFKNGNFPEEYIPTVVDNFVKTITVDGKEVSLTLWDTAGQEDFDNVRPLSYDETSLVILCFSIENKDLLVNIRSKWLPEITNFCPTARFFLVGLKSDIRTMEGVVKEQLVQTSAGKELAKSVNAKEYYECSAKENTNVETIFNDAARHIISLEENGEQVGGGGQGGGCCGMCG